MTFLAQTRELGGEPNKNRKKREPRSRLTFFKNSLLFYSRPSYLQNFIEQFLFLTLFLNDEITEKRNI